MAVSVWNLHATTGLGAEGVARAQLVWLGIGGLLALMVSVIEYHTLRRLAPALYAMSLIALALVLFIGKRVNGSQRWLDFGAFTVQPSEPAKVALIVALAAWLAAQPRPRGYALPDLIPVAVIMGAPMFLIFREPDLGHTLMMFFIGATMMSYERMRRKTVVGGLIAAIIGAPIAWTFALKSYQKERILTLIDGRADHLGAGWQSRQAEVAVGSGGLLGKGHGLGSQVAGGFLPENHTDFVFAKLCEEQGLLGGAFVLVLYLALILSILYTAMTARDRFGALICLGVAALLFWHVFMNIGMVLGLLPVTGVTLPLMSYGGSSVVTTILALGLVFNVHSKRHVF
jgi:rod shape determining protein RodA